MISGEARYRSFVLDGLEQQSDVKPMENLVGQIFLGSGDFMQTMQDLIGDREKIGEIPRAQRYPGWPSLDSLFADVSQKDKEHRNQQIVQAHISHGYTLKEIADHLSIHYSTLSWVVRTKKWHCKTFPPLSPAP
ncbi:MAG: hypothetical protein KJ862_06545 [Proteobacteria bacterium]|nr:hypothetical protein [Pseudomonadota bacterium]